MQNFAIKNVKTNLFWSNLDGWVSDGFDLFTLDESEYFGLPIDGKWVKFSNTMKTFQIFKNVSYEYFVEAETLEAAQTKIIEENPEHESEELIEWVYADEHDGVNWTHEPVTQS
jgi:hypothetical protein